MRICERSNSANTKVTENGGENVPGAGAEIPLQPLVQTMVEAAVPLQPAEDPTLEQVQRNLWLCGKPVLELAPGRTCGPMETGVLTGEHLLAGLVTPPESCAGAVHS